MFHVVLFPIGVQKNPKKFGGFKRSSYLCGMKKEFGKWLLDIAKYMVTALLLSTIFADMREPMIMYLVAIFSLVLLITGLAVIFNSEQEDKKRKRVKQ